MAGRCDLHCSFCHNDDPEHDEFVLFVFDFAEHDGANHEYLASVDQYNKHTCQQRAVSGRQHQLDTPCLDYFNDRLVHFCIKQQQ